jgi:hypothetical protein
MVSLLYAGARSRTLYSGGLRHVRYPEAPRGANRHEYYGAGSGLDVMLPVRRSPAAGFSAFKAPASHGPCEPERMLELSAPITLARRRGAGSRVPFAAPRPE